MVKRRKVLFGIGALAAGGAAATATGAFSAATMDRDANIDVVADDQGLIALSPDNTTTHSSGSSVYQNDNGELEIDLTSDEGGEGVNVNSRYMVGSINLTQVGDDSDSVDEEHVFEPDGTNMLHSSTQNAWGYAFKVTNQSSEDRDITLSYSADQSEVEGYLGFAMETPFGQRRAIEIEGNQTTESATFTDVGPGETVYVSFVVSTIDVDDYSSENLSGHMTVTAN